MDDDIDFVKCSPSLECTLEKVNPSIDNCDVSSSNVSSTVDALLMLQRQEVINTDVQLPEVDDNTEAVYQSGVTEYKCYWCNGTFEVFKALHSHLQQCEWFTDEEKVNRIEEQSVVIGSEEEVMSAEVFSREGMFAGLVNEEGVVTHYECYCCSNIFEDFNDFQLHVESCEMKRRKVSLVFRCESCNIRCEVGKSLGVHGEIGAGEKVFVCNVCTKSFSTGFSLVTHLRTDSHWIEKFTEKALDRCECLYKCKQCEQGYKSRNLLAHLKLHDNKRLNKCDKCDKSFVHKKSLESHIRTHSAEQQRRVKENEEQFKVCVMEQPHQCGKCNKWFPNYGTLVLHMAVHIIEKPYKCCKCDQKFAYYNSLTSHMRTHSAEQQRRVKEEKKQRKMSHKCDKCGNLFLNYSSLVLHSRLHTQQKPHKCVQCDKWFANYNLLVSHTELHMVEKPPHKCYKCGEQFVNYSTLVSHMGSHSIRKPYKCDKCDRRFAHNNSLASHIRTHSVEQQRRQNEEQVKQFKVRTGRQKEELAKWLMIRAGEKNIHQIVPT